MMSNLLRAAREGNVELVKALVHTEHEAVDVGGWTAIHLAAESGHDAVVKLLVEQHPELADRVGMYEWTALHLAAREGFERVAQTLVDHRPSLVDTVDTFGWTALHLAASAGSDKVAQVLLAHNPSVINCVGGSGQTALHVAARSGCDAVVRVLLSLSLAQERRGLLEAVNEDGQTALHLAAENGYGEVVELLLTQLDEEVAARSALDETEEKKEKEEEDVDDERPHKVRKTLMEATPITTTTATTTNTCCEGAVQVGGGGGGRSEHKNAALLMTIDSDGQTALHLAVAHGFASIAEKLLQRQPELAYAIDNSGNTVLHLACKGHRRYEVAFVERVWKLCDEALHVANASRETPFHVAVAHGNQELVAMWQEKVCLDVILTSRMAPAEVLSIVERSLAPLALVLHRDVLRIVTEYLPS